MPNPRWLSFSLVANTIALLLLLGLDGIRITFARLALLCCLGLNTIGLLDTNTRKGKQ